MAFVLNSILNPDSSKVHSSYKVLENATAIFERFNGFMFAEKNDWSGPTMVVGFGVGFTASAGIMNYN